MQAAGKLPRQLPASCCVGVTRGAMMGDQSRRNAGRGTWFSSFKTGFGVLPSRHLCLVRHLVSQAGVADARQLVGQGTGGLVVARPGLQLQRPALERAQGLALCLRRRRRPQHASGAMHQRHAQVRVYQADANTGDGFAILMALACTLRPHGLRRRSPW